MCRVWLGLFVGLGEGFCFCPGLFVGLGEGFLFFMKHAPLSPWERGRGEVGFWWSFLWVLVGLFVFYEACSPLPMGEGPGVRSGFGGAFCGFWWSFLWG